MGEGHLSTEHCHVAMATQNRKRAWEDILRFNTQAAAWTQSTKKNQPPQKLKKEEDKDEDEEFVVSLPIVCLRMIS